MDFLRRLETLVVHCLSQARLLKAFAITFVVIIFSVSIYLNGFFPAQPAVLGVPLTLYFLAVRTFGKGSELEMMSIPIVFSILLAILAPVYNHRQRHQNRPHASVHQVANNAPKPSSKLAPR